LAWRGRAGRGQSSPLHDLAIADQERGRGELAGSRTAGATDTVRQSEAGVRVDAVACGCNQPRAAGKQLVEVARLRATGDAYGRCAVGDDRRQGEGFRFGKRWQAEDAPGIFYDLCWAPATGELYAMSYIDVLGIHRWTVVTWLRPPQTVTVLTIVHDLSDLQAMLAGWKDREEEYGSLEWVKQQVGCARPTEFFAADLGEGQRRVCRGWYEKLLHFEQPGIDVAAGPRGVALCRPEEWCEGEGEFFAWREVVDITAGPWRWPHRHHLFPPPAAGHCYLNVEAGDEDHILLVPGADQIC